MRFTVAKRFQSMSVIDGRRVCASRFAECLQFFINQRAFLDLLGEAALLLEQGDVIANQNKGYHLRDWISVLDGLDEAQKAAEEKQVVLTENQKGIIRLLRKHEKRTPRQLSDGLHLLRNTVTNEVEALITAGLAVSEGNGANRTIRLAAS